MRPSDFFLDAVLPDDAVLPRDWLLPAADELRERTLRPLALPDRRAPAERPLAVLLEAERALEAPRALEWDRDRALLDTTFLAERDFPAPFLTDRLLLRTPTHTHRQMPAHYHWGFITKFIVEANMLCNIA